MRKKNLVIIFVSVLSILTMSVSCEKKKRIGHGEIEVQDAGKVEKNTNEYGPLISVTADEFLKLPREYQIIYVAGYIDATTLFSYGYSFPDHNDLVECFRSRSIGKFTDEVVKWLKNHPDFEESVATAIARTTSVLFKNS